MRAPTLLLTALTAVVPLVPALAAGTPDDRVAAYQAFRAAFDKGDYKAALPAADRVVEMTASQFGKDAPENANALTNLATTYYRMKAYGDALDAYRSAITVLELQSDPTDKRLVRPLQGLGSALLAMQRADEAVVPLKRAVDIVRNRDGLRAEAQLPILRTLIAAYAATDHAADAGREQEYAFSVAEAAYGKNDLRMLGPIDDLARWNEQTGHYTAARLLHTRAVDIADAAKPDNPAAVPALRGIARCFRLSYVFGESSDSVDVATRAANDALSGSLLAQAANAPSSDGERALRTALARLGDAADKAAERGAVLLDLGDWFLTANKISRALDNWRLAWKELSAVGDTSALDKPTAVIYIAPSVAVSDHQRDPDENKEERVELQVAIDANGSVRDATVSNPAPERESAEKAVIAAVRRAAWRPAFRDGQPIAVDDFKFHELVYVKVPKTAR
jgi:tetratricopeptide (TPR) repeat protein